MRARDVMKKIGGLWDRFWFSPCDPLPLAYFRISLGILITLMLVALSPNWERYFAADGVVFLGPADLQNWPWDLWNVFQWTESFLPIRFLWWVGLAAAVSFTVGWRTRLATVVLFIIQISMNHRSVVTSNGEDHVFRTLLFYGCFAPLGEALSIDAWRRRRQGRDGAWLAHPIWPVRLMQVNIALIYVFSLYDKLAFEPAWRNGTAMYWILMNELWSAWPWPKIFYGGWGLSKLMTYFAVVVEALFPVLVWFRKTRPFVLAAATVLHLSIAVVLRNVEFFTLSMICSFWLFVPGEFLRRYHFDKIYRFERSAKS